MAVLHIVTATLQSGASTTLTYSGAVTAGSTLVAGGFNYNSAGTPAVPAISDTVNGAWTVQKWDQGGVLPGIDANIEVWLAAFENTAGGTPVVTWNPNGTGADMGGWFICEVTGATTPTSVDVIPATSITTGLTPSIASGTLAQADEVLFAVMTGATNSGTVTIAPDATYNELVVNGDNSSSQMGSAQYKIVSSTTSDTADWTVTDTGGGSVNKISILLSVKASADGGPPSDLQLGLTPSRVGHRPAPWAPGITR